VGKNNVYEERERQTDRQTDRQNEKEKKKGLNNVYVIT
jgi:hypothetical protein